MLLEFPRNHVLSLSKKIKFLICTLCTYPQSVHTHPLSSFNRKITLPLISKILFISISTIVVFVSSSFVSVGTNHVPHSFLDRNSVLTFPSSSIAVSYCPNRHHWSPFSSCQKFVHFGESRKRGIGKIPCLPPHAMKFSINLSHLISTPLFHFEQVVYPSTMS